MTTAFARQYNDIAFGSELRSSHASLEVCTDYDHGSLLALSVPVTASRTHVTPAYFRGPSRQALQTR